MTELQKRIKRGERIDRWHEMGAMWEMQDWVNTLQKEGPLPEIWTENGEYNIPWLDAHKDRIVGSTWDLPKYGNKAVIYVGASPMLKYTYHHLKGADDDFIIVAVNSSAQFLVEHDIIPDYVVCIDGQYSGHWTLDLGEKAKDVVGIFSPYVVPRALQEWPGKIMIVPYRHNKNKKLWQRVKRRYGAPVASGGNALNAAYAAFVMCTKAAVHLFVGNELSWRDKYQDMKGRYYVHREPSAGEAMQATFKAKDVRGKTVNTLIPLWTYKTWLENQMHRSVPTYQYFNCSEGIVGVDVDGSLLPFVHQKPLDEAIQIVKDAFAFDDLPWYHKSQIVYTNLFKHKNYEPKTQHGMWQGCKKIKGWKKGLDVGCGHAGGIKTIIDEGYDVYGIDIADLENEWEKAGIADRCRVGSAHKMPYKDNEFDLIVCTETLEHIPTKNVPETLDEILRVGSDKFLFTIATMPDDEFWASGVQLHLTLQPREWWEEKLKEHGFTVLHGAPMIRLSDGDTEINRGSIVLCAKDKDKYGNAFEWFEDNAIVEKWERA